jgi:hypothetical protein
VINFLFLCRMSTSSKSSTHVTYDQCVKKYEGLLLGNLCADMSGHPSGSTMAFIVSSFTKKLPESMQKIEGWKHRGFQRYPNAS